MANLDKKHQQVLDSLRALGPGWHTRAELASRMGKNKLNPSEVTLLDVLASMGEIDKEMRPTSAAHILQSVYRIKEADG